MEHNGKMLAEHYMDPFKVRDMMDLGDLSTLGPNIGEKHSFDIQAKYGTPEYTAEAEHKATMCTFYGRDRGENGTEARKFADLTDYKKECQGEEYDYILLPDGKWYVRHYGTAGKWVSLAEELAKVEETV